MDELKEMLSFKDCGYVDVIEDWIRIENKNDFNIIYLNIGAIRKNFASLIAYLDTVITKIHVIVLVEININQLLVSRGLVNLECFMIQGYKLEHKLRPKGQGGGIFVYVREELKYDVKTLETLHFEAFCMNLKNVKKGKNDKETVLLSVYRPPKKKKSEFIQEIRRHIEGFAAENSVLVVGDFNINLNRKSKYAEEMKDMIAELGLVRGVTVNTREVWHGGKLKRSCIDNIFIREAGTLENKKLETGVMKTKISDHYMLGLKIDPEGDWIANSKNREKKTIINDERVFEKIQEIKWSEDVKEPDVIYEEVKDRLKKVYDESKVEVKNNGNKKRKPKIWVTEEIKQGTIERDKLFREFKQSVRRGRPDEELHLKYKKVRNELNRKIEREQKNYSYNQMEEHKNDARKMWSDINQMLGRKKRQNIDELIEKHMISETVNAQQVVDNFAKTFKEEVDRCRHECPIITVPQGSKEADQSMRFVRATEERMEKILQEMKVKTGSGTDGIRMKDLVHDKKKILKMLKNFVNGSVQSGKIPKECKVARVRPIYKSGSHEEYTNYRPISILNSMSKILEKHVYNITMEYVKKNNIIHPNQYGFQPGKRISTLLSEISGKIYSNLDRGEYTMCIMIDYKKAFDTLGHETIIRALHRIGIRGQLLEWYREYLRERKYVVNITDVESEEIDLESGVPQGSFLGPLLFIIVMNSLFDNVTDCEVFMYADDVFLLLSDKCLKKLYERAQKVFNSVQAWSHDNGLTLNAKKTQCMIIQDERKREKGEGILIVHDNECLHDLSRTETVCSCTRRIERVKVAKYLGIYLDEFFTWKEQVEHVRGKLRACLAGMVRLGRRADNRIKKLVYMALGDSHLNYGITAWGNCSITERKKLTTIQSKILRYMYGEEYKKKSKKNNIMSIERKFIFRKYVDYYFDEQYKQAKVQVRATRASAKTTYVTPRVRTDYGFKTNHWLLPKIWEELPDNLKDLITYRGIKFFGQEWVQNLNRDIFENKFKVKMKPKKRECKIKSGGRLTNKPKANRRKKIIIKRK